MSATLANPIFQFRIIRRHALHRSVSVSVRMVRPSLIDLRLRGDPWLISVNGETLGLCFDNWHLAGVAASPLDLPSLNQLLQHLRRPCPHRR
jgi:hypothetical protein